MVFGVTVLVFLGVVGYFFWPTTYRYYAVNTSPMRENRFTGCIEMLTNVGWIERSDNCPKVLAQRPIWETLNDPKSIALIEGRATVNSNRLEVEVYNGLTCLIEAMTVGLTLGGNRREYKVTSGEIYAKSTGSLSTRIFDSDQFVKPGWGWDIVGIEVVRPQKQTDCY